MAGKILDMPPGSYSVEPSATRGMAGVGNAIPSELTGLIPDAIRPHVILTTPVGVAIIDPLAPGDAATYETLNALGISMNVIFGPVPDDIQQAANQNPIAANLGMVALGVGALLLYAWSRRS